MASEVKKGKIGSCVNTGINTVINSTLTIPVNYQYIVETSISINAPLIINGQLIIN
jgi:hypothetical protein